MMSTLRRARLLLAANVGAATLFSVISVSAAAAPSAATDWFVGKAGIVAGQTSPVVVNPNDIRVRNDGAVGLGYAYRAAGQASSQLPGTFTYEEHGYLYFRNPSDPTTLAGSSFSSGVFRLVPFRRAGSIDIADIAPETYTSGVQTVFTRLAPQVERIVGGSQGRAGPLTYGYFTFTNPNGTFTGYATPDFVNFAIQITFDAPV